MEQDKIEIPVDPRLNKETLVNPYKDDAVDLLDSLTKDDERECIKRALNKVDKEHNIALDLEKSTLRVSNQEYVLVSFVAPKGTRQRTDQLGLKVWGAFPTPELAGEHAKKLNAMEENKYFDIYTLEMYAWAAIPPDPRQIESQEFHDKRLDYLIKSHKVEKERAREIFDMRTFKLMEDGNEKVKKLKANKTNDLQRETIMPSKKLPKFTIEPEPPCPPSVELGAIDEEEEEEEEDIPELVEDEPPSEA